MRFVLLENRTSVKLDHLAVILARPDKEPKVLFQHFPKITQSSGIAPKADDVVVFLRKFYEKEKRQSLTYTQNPRSPKPVIKMIHLQNTGSNRGRSPRETFEFVNAKPIYPILMATSDSNFESNARINSFGTDRIFIDK